MNDDLEKADRRFHAGIDRIIARNHGFEELPDDYGAGRPGWQVGAAVLAALVLSVAGWYFILTR